MILLLHGADSLAIRRRLLQLKEEADGGSGMLMTNLAEIDGRDAKPHDILGPAMSPPFLAPRRMVVVENLLERFEPPKGGGQPRSIQPLEPLFAGLAAGIPDSTILVFTAGPLGDRNPLLVKLKSMANSAGIIDEPHAGLRPADAPRYIRDEAGIRGLRLRSGRSVRSHHDSEVWVSETAADPAALLAVLTNADTLRIANELDKLALFTMGREVTVDDVFDICGGDREFGQFAFADAVVDQKHLDALRILAHLLQRGESWQGLLGQLMASYRTLATVVDLLEEGATPEEIGKAIRRPWPALRDAAIRRARRLGPAGLEAAYEALVDIDRRAKLGEIDDELALDLLIARLVCIGSPPAARAG